MRQVYHATMGAGLFAQPFSGSLRPPSFGTELSCVELQMSTLRDHRNNRLLFLLHKTAKRLSHRWQHDSSEESTMSLPGGIMQRGIFSSEKNKGQRVNGYARGKNVVPHQKHGAHPQMAKNEKMNIAARLRGKKGIIL